MKKVYILLLLLFLVGCDNASTESTSTTSTTTEGETLEQPYTIITAELCDPLITTPELTKSSSFIYSTEICGAISYEFTVTDISEEIWTSETDGFYQIVFFETSNMLELSKLPNNRTYSIVVKVTTEDDVTYESSAFTIEQYSTVNTIEVDYNLNNGFGLYLEDLSGVEVFYYRNLISVFENFYNTLAVPMLKHVFFSGATNDMEVQAYTAEGIYIININLLEITKPYIISDNEVDFVGNDLAFIFDFCQGELVDINGSLLSTSDYTLTDNILVIEAEFIQNIFDEEPERDTVILAYQLRNDTDIVIGYLFINRT
ncbi:MAG: hypothetical protein JEZ05_00935 [Tenericutes bacterium]|nr:hypothetical protein [Mycoplasmatota bacterium]